MPYKNKEDEIKYQRDYYLKNREKIIEQGKQYAKDHPESLNKARKKWARNNPDKRMLAAARNNAKAKGLDFNLELSDIVIPTHCPYLGVPLCANQEEVRRFNNISLDRIDSSKGYVKGNVQVISYLANKMKQDASIEELLTFAEGIKRIHG